MELDGVSEVFAQFDLDGDGFIGWDDLRAFSSISRSS